MVHTGLEIRLASLKMLLYARGNAYRNAEYISKHKLFYHMGKGCYFHPRKIPTEPQLISMGDNVWIASGVRFITHDMSGDMLKNAPQYKEAFSKIYSPYYMGKIEIGDNVMVGTDAVIMYHTKIGNNVIIAAGAVITKDVPDGSVVAGIPARIVGSIDDFAAKRLEELRTMPKKEDGLEGLVEYFWGKEK